MITDTLRVMIIMSDAGVYGAALSFVDMADALVGYVDYHVVIPEKGPLINYLLNRNITFYIVPYSVGYGFESVISSEIENHYLLDNYEAALTLLDIVNKESIDIIHSNSSVIDVGAILSLISGIPHVWHIRELVEKHYGKRYYFSDLKKSLLQSASCIIAISDCVKMELQERYELDSTRLYDGFNVDKYVKSSGIDKNPEGILLIGNIAEDKCQLDVIKAIEKNVQYHENITLNIIGSGIGRYPWVLKKYVKIRRLEKHVQFLGYQDNLDIFRCNNSISIVASRMEALGRVTVESMLAENIVIGSDTGGTLEMIGKDEERGFLFQQGSIESLVKVLDNVLRLSPSNKNLKVSSAKRYAIQHFDSKKYAHNILCCYKYAINSKKPPNSTLLKRIKDIIKGINTRKIIHKKMDDPAKAIKAKWEELNSLGFMINDWFVKNEVSSIAIYGMGDLGCRLFDELSATSIVKAVIDRDDTYLTEFVNVWRDDGIGRVDVIVVAISGQEDTIVDSLAKEGYKSVGLSKIIDDLIVDA